MFTSPTLARSVFALLLGLSLLSTPGRSAAQELPTPETLPRLDPSTAAHAAVRAPQTEDQVATGDLGAQVAAGLGAGSLAVLLGAGIAATTVATCEPEQDFCGLGKVLHGVAYYLIAAPFLVTGGVVAAATATGGNGSVFWTAVGATTGVLVGFYPGLATLVALSNSDMNLPLAARIAASGFVALVPAVAGATLGYQLSADVPVQAMALPTLDGRGAMFTLSGAM